MNQLPSFLQELDPKLYFSDNYVVLDFETDTSHGDYGSAVHPDNNLLLACWKVGPKGKMKRIWGGELDMAPLVSDIQKADFVVAHNAKYELMWLKRCGLDLSNVVVFDTKIAEYVLFGNRIAGDKMMAPLSSSLDMCCRRRGLPIKDPVVDIMIKAGINPIRIPRRWLQGRCEQDVVTTEQVYRDQLRHLFVTDRLPIQFTRCLLTPVLSHVEFEGMALDWERVEEEHAAHLAEFVKQSAIMDEMTGGINWRSPQQIAEYIYDTLGFEELKDYKGQPKRTAVTKRTLKDGTVKFGGGNRLTDNTTLDALGAKTDAQREFLEVRKALGKVAAALSKNLDFFLGICKEYGGTFYATFNQTSTATHRLSSSGIETYFETFEAAKKVQFQNLPRDFKRLFMARNPGWLMGETDGSQLEFRTVVHQSRDVQGREDIISGHDVHRFTASVLNQVAMDEVTGAQRQDAKPDTFKPVYGGTSGTPEQQAYYAAFRERYPELTTTQEGWVCEVVNTKRLITEWGMRYYWPKAKRKKSGWCNVTSSVYNYPVQALATAEIIPIAITFFWHRVQAEGLGEYIRLVNTVHDSIVCEIHPEYVEDYKRISMQAFTHDVYDYLERVYAIRFDWVPLGVGIKVGEHWGEGKEEEYNVYINGEVHQKIDKKWQVIQEAA